MIRSELLAEILKYSIEEFIKKATTANISKERAIILRKVLVKEISVSHFTRFDIEEFAIKLFHPKDIYNQIRTPEHIGSKSETFEYDPAKNGQNIIKHGIAFGEVLSYSLQFGSLMIQIPYELDDQRSLLLSDLILDKDRKIELPLRKMNHKEFTLAVVAHINGKFRFISARSLGLNKDNIYKNINQSINCIDFPCKNLKKEFAEHCMKIFERNFLHKPPSRQ